MPRQIPGTLRHFGLGAALLAGLLAAGSAAAEPQALLVLDVSRQAEKGEPYYLPVGFVYDTPISALVFSINIDTRRLRFNPADDDMDGVPDAVILPQGRPSITYVVYDPDDTNGELDIMLANLSGAPLPQGTILIVKLRPRRRGSVFSWVDFADDPAPSFGNAQGQTVEGTTLVLGAEIFADGFESGDTRRWSITTTPED